MSSLMPDLLPLTTLLEVKLSQGEAFSEYQLIHWLQQPEQNLFSATALTHSASLFHCHFLVMHVLYCLQQRWLDQRTALLDISAVHIQKKPWVNGQMKQSLGHVDPLASYYLDLTNLHTSEDEINRLLQRFWHTMLSPKASAEEDFATLELANTASAKEIQQQFRRLAMQHHPDRGGNSERFHAIQTAYQRLIKK